MTHSAALTGGRRKLPYDISRKLGSGHFGRVYEGKNLRNGQRVALKIYKSRTDDKLIELEIQNNKRVRRYGRHPNIITFLGDYVYGSEKRVVLAFEYAEGGDMLTRLADLGSFSEADTKDIILGVLKGLDHLHRHRIMHRDIKPANILLKTKSLPHEPALSDFGVSAKLKSGRVPVYMEAGTMPYNPPEAFRFDLVGRKGDIWAVGVVMHEMLLGERPFTGSSSEDSEKVIKEILTKRIDFNSEHYRVISPEGRDLMRKLLTKNPNHRKLADELLGHPWFTNAPDKKMFTASRLIRGRNGGGWTARIHLQAIIPRFRWRRSRSRGTRTRRRMRARSARTKGKTTDWRRVPARKVRVRMPNRDEAARKRSPRR